MALRSLAGPAAFLFALSLPPVPSRRRFLAASVLATLGAPLAAAAQAPDTTRRKGPFRLRFTEPPPALPPAPLDSTTVAAPLVLPPGTTPMRPARLRDGDLVALVTPAGPVSPDEVRDAEAALHDLGLRTLRGRHALDRRGYLGGADVARAADLMEMFRDPEVKAILPLRGGWGCARMLPYLDYEAIRANPKIVCGYSDITALLAALYTKAGLVSYHGPVGTSTWNSFSVGYFRRVLFDGLPVTMPAPDRAGVDTINGGVARGRLIGGNLSVLSALVGTPYLPDTSGHLIFLEEVQEEPYRIDRMMTQLRLAGLFDRAAGVFFGNCKNCAPSDPAGSLSLAEVLRDHLRPLGLPAFYGTAIGHITDKFTLPVGGYAEMDADTGTIRLLEPGVD